MHSQFENKIRELHSCLAKKKVEKVAVIIGLLKGVNQN